MQKFPITQEGFTRLEEECRRLKAVERPVVIEQIATAREHGDLKENAEYHAAREKQSFIEGRIQELESILGFAEVIDIARLSGTKVKFGATVVIIDCDTEKEHIYKIVGEHEASLESGLISFASPLARGLIGKEEGDEVAVAIPSGKKTYEILEVKFK